MAVLKYLILSQNQLSGNIPRELGHLSKLKRLNLYGNNLTGKIPPELGHPPEFYWLFLDRNNLQGEIPPELGRLKSLQRLSLGKNQLSGQIPTSLSHLKQLKWLNLCQNQLTGTIPEELGNMRNLRWLHLDGNHLSGSIPKALEDLVWLTALDLSHNRFTSIPASMPKCCRLQTDIANILSVRAVLVRVAAWFVWVCIVILLSLPSILFAVAQAVPANAAGLNEKVLSWIHRAAPYLIVLIELLLAHPLSTKYSARSGIEADRLLMTFRLSSAWFMSLLATAFLHENCFAGWKLFWVVCQESSAEHEAFNWKLWSQEILFAKKDMCRLGERWWVDGRCTRSIVDGLTPLLLKKLLVRSVVVPLVLLPLWYSSRLDTSCAPLNAQKGRHLRLLGGLKVTGSLVPLRQTALLTTFMEVLFFWSPLIPLLSLCILSATAANFFLFDVGIRSFNVQVPLDAMNQSATLSRCESGFSPECLIKGFF